MAGFLGLFGAKSMEDYVQEASTLDGALVIDVRSEQEYATGHLAGAINIPGNVIAKVESIAPDKQTPLYVHCLSGHRSAAAVRKLKALGYDHVTNMGGIARYKGELVKGA